MNTEGSVKRAQMERETEKEERNKSKGKITEGARETTEMKSRR